MQKIMILLPFGDTISSEIISVNRINYEFIFKNHTVAGGASPGLLASIFYIPVFQYSMLFIVFYSLLD